MKQARTTLGISSKRNLIEGPSYIGDRELRSLKGVGRPPRDYLQQKVASILRAGEYREEVVLLGPEPKNYGSSWSKVMVVHQVLSP